MKACNEAGTDVGGVRQQVQLLVELDHQVELVFLAVDRGLVDPAYPLLVHVDEGLQVHERFFPLPVHRTDIPQSCLIVVPNQVPATSGLSLDQAVLSRKSAP